MNHTPIYTRLCKGPEVFNVSVSTLRRWEERGDIKFHKPSKGAVFLHNEQLRAYIEGLGE